MNRETAEGQWNEVKGKIRETWTKLTDSDLEVVAGKEDRLVGLLQQRYGYLKERTRRVADHMIASV